jgi:hypothetical protein
MGRKVLQDQDILTVQVVVMMVVFMAIMEVAWPAMIKSLIENTVDDIPWMICSSLAMKRRMILTGNLLLAVLRTDGFA